MNDLLFSLIVCCTSILAGFLGALTGLGGGVVIVPVLALLFKIDLRYAIGASLVSVIATSSGAAAAYVRDGFSNIRIGMFLEVATTIGALTGAWLVAKVSTGWIGVIFGVVLLYSAWMSVRKRAPVSVASQEDALGSRLNMKGSYPVGDGKREAYIAHHVPGGFAIMYLAGVLSGLLGIGSGAVKVLAMDQVMRLPFKVSTTTSNFMIGVTAAASAGVYLSRGYILPGLAMPVMLGVLGGSLAGSRVLVRAHVKTLRMVFALVIVALGAQMIFSGLTGRL
ncbi:MAG TPA: sulfite exporter TauE/SafE family protein [Terracidiphilus sp.]|nr:sulfite exporter TauE/SafE family protein [Terracidiphilus sp.]